jgi:hypothetical protein
VVVVVVVAVVVVFLAASVPVDAFPPFSFFSPNLFCSGLSVAISWSLIFFVAIHMFVLSAVLWMMLWLLLWLLLWSLL